MTKYGLLIDYEYCTGCHACEVACRQEQDRTAGMGGIKVFEHIQELQGGGKLYITYFPFPTRLCNLCAHRIRDGKEPSCVKHCMANVMKFGPIDEMAKEIQKKPEQVLWIPNQPL